MSKARSHKKKGTLRLEWSESQCTSEDGSLLRQKWDGMANGTSYITIALMEERYHVHLHGDRYCCPPIEGYSGVVSKGATLEQAQELSESLLADFLTERVHTIKWSDKDNFLKWNPAFMALQVMGGPPHKGPLLSFPGPGGMVDVAYAGTHYDIFLPIRPKGWPPCLRVMEMDSLAEEEAG